MVPGGAAGAARGYRIAARASPPLTRRGPGRTTMPSASIAHTGTSARPASPSATDRACSTAPARWNPHGATTTRSGPAAAISAQLVGTDAWPGRAATASPPAATTRSGTQCPALNGGSTHSTTATFGRPRPAALVPATLVPAALVPATLVPATLVRLSLAP